MAPGQKVVVYYNLHKHVFSIKDHKSGLVLGHAPTLSMIACEFVVSEAGRQRVIAEQRKSVHAYIVGTYVGAKNYQVDGLKMGMYNPYRFDSFVAEEGERLERADFLICKGKRVYFK